MSSSVPQEPAAVVTTEHGIAAEAAAIEVDDDKTKHPQIEDQSAFLPARQIMLVFLALSTAVSMGFMDQTIVAAALPRIADDLHSGKLKDYVATSYLLTSLAFTPLYGRWSDILGRKAVLLGALTWFAFTSMACALAQTMIQLIVFRALQGIGGGGLITMALIIISDIVSLRDRGRYMGIIDIIVIISGSLGSFLGGVFSQYATWRWAFWINLPLSVMSAAVSIWLLPLKGVSGNMREKFLKIDYMGSALTVASSVLILVGLNWGGVTYPWASAAVLVPMLVGGLVFALFVVWEGRFAKVPIIPLGIFKYPTVVGMCICILMSGMTMFTMMYFIPQFFQLVRGATYLHASLIAMAFLAPISAVVFVAGQISTRTGHYRWLIIVGHALWCLAQGLMCRVTVQTTDAYIIGMLILAGAASGLVLQTALLGAQAAVPRHEMAVVTGMRNFVRLIGNTIGLAAAGAIVSNALRHGVSTSDISSDMISKLLDDPATVNAQGKDALLTELQREIVVNAYLEGFRGVFYMAVACQVVATLSAVLLIKQHDLQRADDHKLKEEGRAVISRLKGSKNAQHEHDLEKQNNFPANDRDDENEKDNEGTVHQMTDQSLEQHLTTNSVGDTEWLKLEGNQKR
ncbi:MFS general substrate transporter [Auriculariales sp. MPI-PUGE-AT-0066]|nr:MFS general substrate transporter [Auriculariales sp. MPI-PUGE-AT-0066]